MGLVHHLPSAAFSLTSFIMGHTQRWIRSKSLVYPIFKAEELFIHHLFMLLLQTVTGRWVLFRQSAFLIYLGKLIMDQNLNKFNVKVQYLGENSSNIGAVCLHSLVTLH